MNNNIVSIITPSFNRADIITETAASIFNQTYPYWEWVIVDDGSTDNSWEILKTFAAKDERVKIFQRNRASKGACTCRNIAVENCCGDYLIFLDTDDLMASFCLEQRVNALHQNPECDFIIFPMLLFKNQPDDLSLLWNVDSDEDDLSRILKGDPVCQGTGTLWKKPSFQKVGMWKEDLKLWQDIELHIRSILWPMKYSKRMDLKPDVFLRISDNSLSRGGYYSFPKMTSRISVFTDACNKIAQSNLLDQYKEGLRIMGFDIIVSTIKSKYFTEAKTVIELCALHQIFSKTEIKQLKQFKRFFSIKLYKLPPVFKPLEQNLKKIISSFEISLTKIKWDHPIQL